MPKKIDEFEETQIVAAIQRRGTLCMTNSTSSGSDKDGILKEESRAVFKDNDTNLKSENIRIVAGPIRGREQYIQIVKNGQKKTLPASTYPTKNVKFNDHSKKKTFKRRHKGSNPNAMIHSFYEAREIQSALASGERDITKIWSISLGLVGILDCIFFCLERAKRNSLENKIVPTVSILDSLAEMQKLRNDAIYSLITRWTGYNVDMKVPENEISRFCSFEQCATLASTTFRTLWIIESARRGVLFALTKASPKPMASEKKTIGNTLQSPYIRVFTAFIFYLLLLPTCYVAWYELANDRINELLYNFAKRFTIKTTFFAIAHPTLFRKRVISTLNILRWMRYLVPILGNANTLHVYRKKLKESVQAHRNAKKAQGVIELLWGSTNEKKNDQNHFLRRLRSSFQGIKVPWNVKCAVVSQEQIAAVRIQRFFRRYLNKIDFHKMHQKRITSQSIRLQKLRENRMQACSMVFKNMRQSRYVNYQDLRQSITNTLSIKDLMREKMLELELERELERKRKMLILLRPNSLFCTVWAAIVMSCIGIDMMLKYIEAKAPTLKDERSGVPYSLDSYLHHSLLPTPIQEMNFCSPYEGDVVPWYCSGFFVLIQSAYIKLAKYAINEMLDLVALILLFDVFVSFCIGDFDQSGMLVPKPFVERWVLGISLKLLLNPLSKSKAQALVSFSLEAAPTRVVRWYLAFFGPLVQIFVWRVWITTVHSGAV